MLFKAVLTFLAVGALSVNALTIPVARSPAPEPESRELEARMFRRDLSYALLSRELQALDELFSREPEDWAEWGYMAKRQTKTKPKNNGPTPVVTTGWTTPRPGTVPPPNSPV